MTDNDIIKALECCRNGLCTDCPRLNTPSAILRCKEELMCEALDLINRQKAEIERLQNNNGERADHYTKLLEAERKKQKCLKEIAVREAVKEFAERLKEEARTIDDDYSPNGEITIIEVEDIDNLLKEMVGEG